MCLQGCEEEFDPQYHTEEKAKADSEAFYKAGQGKMGTNEKKMFEIICFSPPQHLRAVGADYADKRGYTLSKALEKELGSGVEDAGLFIVGMKLKPYETIANLIKKSCKGFGTDELLLTACIVRYQNILHQVMIAYIELFGKTIQDLVKEETGGDYRKLLLTLLDRVMPRE